jgi:hypothetical protein
MTRRTRRWIRAVSVSAISAGVALLYAPRPAQAASTCPSILLTCSSPGTCSFGQSVWVTICDNACNTAGGPTCIERPGFPVQCEAVGCSNGDAELFCHCGT